MFKLTTRKSDDYLFCLLVFYTAVMRIDVAYVVLCRRIKLFVVHCFNGNVGHR